MNKHVEQQKQLDRISNELSQINWHDEFGGGVATGPFQRPRKDAIDFGGMVREEKHTVRPSSFTDRDFEELARRDPSFKKQLDEQKKEQVTTTFTTLNPDYIANAGNYETMCRYIKNNQLRDPHLDIDDLVDVAFEKGLWTVENLTAVFEHLKTKGRLELPAEKPKELTNEEKLIVIAKVRQGNPEEAILSYLRFALPSRDVRYLTMETFAVEYPALLNKTVWTVFQLMHPELSPEEFKAFALSMRHVALPTVALLDTALYQQRENRYLSRNTAPAPASPSPEPVERELTEDEIRALPTGDLDELIAREKKEVLRQMYRL